MKYTRLTKEQFEELHQEFINFLATQQITATEWDSIKQNKPEVAEQELDVFSDLIWEGVLNKTKFLEHISPKSMHLFAVKEGFMHVIALKINAAVDITTSEGYKWLKENLMNDAVEFLQAQKPFADEKNKSIFKLITEGAVITKGALYTYFNDLIN